MIAPVLVTLSVPAMTTVAALLWARFVANGMAYLPETDITERSRDIRTW
jgi:hypothetical protein